MAAAQKNENELKTRMWYSPHETHAFLILQETVFSFYIYNYTCGHYSVMLWHFDCLLLRVVSFQDPILSWGKGLVTIERFLDIHSSNCHQTRLPWGLGMRLAQSDFRRTTSQYVQYFDQLSPRKYSIIPILSNILPLWSVWTTYNKVWKIHFVLWGVEREKERGGMEK